MQQVLAKVFSMRFLELAASNLHLSRDMSLGLCIRAVHARELILETHFWPIEFFFELRSCFSQRKTLITIHLNPLH